MSEASIEELQSRSLDRIAAARSAGDLETVRVEALGRKGALTQFSKEMGKLPPDERKHMGMLLNSAKQKIEDALEIRQREFASSALNARLDAEWLDLTLPAPEPHRGHLHPITQI